MGNVTKDSYQESNLHTKVVFQRGKDVVDFELNEFQDILRVQQYRALVAESGGLNPGSNDDGYLVVGTGAVNAVTLRAGTLFCDGIPIVLTEDIVYNELATNGGGSPVSNTIYLQVSEQEIPDPAMVPQLGETSKRRKLFVEVAHVVGTTLPVDEPPVIWQGGTRYFPLARITRNPGIAAIAPADVSDLRKRLPAFTVKRLVDQFYVDSGNLASHQHNYNPPGLSDAFVLRFNPTVPVNLTGMNADVQYRRKTIVNRGTAPLTVLAEDGASIAANRFVNGVEVQPNGAVEATYDYGISRWRLLLAGEAAQIPDEIVITDSPYTAPSYPDAYNPPGWDLATVVRIDSSVDGIYMTAMAPASRKRKLIINVGVGPIAFASQAYGPPEESQIRAGQGGSSQTYVMNPWSGALFLYSEVSQKWEMASPVLPLDMALHNLSVQSIYLNSGGTIRYSPNPETRVSVIGIEEFVINDVGWQESADGKYIETKAPGASGTAYVNIPTTGQGYFYGVQETPIEVALGGYQSTPIDIGSISPVNTPAKLPLKFPSGSIITKIEVLCHETQGVLPANPLKLSLFNRSGLLANVNGWTTATKTDKVMTHVGSEVVTFDVNITVDNSQGNLGLYAYPAHGAFDYLGGTRIYWVKVTWKDPGPRND